MTAPERIFGKFLHLCLSGKCRLHYLVFFNVFSKNLIVSEKIKKNWKMYFCVIIESATTCSGVEIAIYRENTKYI